MKVAILIISLIVIFFGAMIFANGIEWLGMRLKLGHGAVGSILAAVGTAMPETMIPIIAIFFSGAGHLSDEIGIGAILGAPFMLATLVFFLCGLSAIVFARRRAKLLPALMAEGGAGTVTERTFQKPTLTCDVAVIRRDLGFFLPVYTVAFLTAFVQVMTIRYIVAACLVLAYLAYAAYTLRQAREEFKEKEEEEEKEEIGPLYLARRSLNPPVLLILLQVLIGLGLIIGGARFFVSSTQELAIAMGVPAFILALLIAPITTELPETFNSFFWISQGKDTIALGNVCGAMIIQSSVLPAIGIAFTKWDLTPAALISCILAVASAALVLTQVVVRSSPKAIASVEGLGVDLAGHQRSFLKPITLIIGGIFYIAFVVLVLMGVIK